VDLIVPGRSCSGAKAQQGHQNAPGVVLEKTEGGSGVLDWFCFVLLGVAAVVVVVAVPVE
jgi:hypothetical protein